MTVMVYYHAIVSGNGHHIYGGRGRDITPCTSLVAKLINIVQQQRQFELFQPYFSWKCYHEPKPHNAWSEPFTCVSWLWSLHYRDCEVFDGIVWINTPLDPTWSVVKVSATITIYTGCAEYNYTATCAQGENTPLVLGFLLGTCQAWAVLLCRARGAFN